MGRKGWLILKWLEIWLWSWGWRGFKWLWENRVLLWNSWRILLKKLLDRLKLRNLIKLWERGITSTQKREKMLGFCREITYKHHSWVLYKKIKYYKSNQLNKAGYNNYITWANTNPNYLFVLLSHPITMLKIIDFNSICKAYSNKNIKIFMSSSLMMHQPTTLVFYWSVF